VIDVASVPSAAPRIARASQRPGGPRGAGAGAVDRIGAWHQTARMRVVVADDSLLVREGIVSLLRRAGIEVVAEAASGEELVALAAEHVPDVAIVDVRMPPTHTDEGIRAAQALRSRDPAMAVVILSQHLEVGVAMRVLAESPARLGYLLKDRVTDVEEFVRTLHHVAAGGTALDPQVVSRLLAATREDGPLTSLTPREREVLALIAEGRSNRGIGDRLGVSAGVVQKHVSSVFGKLALPAGDDDDRRILAVLAFLRSGAPERA
jgi:DNA-binding NarL/FixJ family response regulator